MSRLRYAGLVGSVGSGNLTSSATTHTFTAPLTYGHGVTVPTLAGTDTFLLTILDASGDLSEVVQVTAYNSSTGAATIVRGREGTSGVAHTSGDEVTLAGYASDLTASEDTYWYLDLNFQFPTGSIEMFTTSSARSTWTYTSGEFFSNGAQNESISFQGWWGPGALTIDHVGVPSGNRGIVTWAVQIDDGTYVDVGTVDWSTGSGNTAKSLTFTMPSGVDVVKRRYIRAKAATKNASASAYYLDFMRLWIVKSAI